MRDTKQHSMMQRWVLIGNLNYIQSEVYWPVQINLTAQSLHDLIVNDNPNIALGL